MLMTVCSSAHAETWTCQISGSRAMRWTVSGNKLVGKSASDISPRQNEQLSIVKNDADVLATLDEGFAGEVDVMLIDKTMRSVSRYALVASRAMDPTDQRNGGCWRSP
jgi:hypothetical protein